jgi:hypothetical protein
MKNRLLMLCALLAMTSMVTFAAAIDGKWTAEVQGRGPAPQVTTLTLKADASGKLTGTVEGGGGGRGGGAPMPLDITEGTVTGAMNVSFKVVQDLGEKGKRTRTYTGMLMGDDLKLTVVTDPAGKGGPADMDFKRAK